MTKKTNKPEEILEPEIVVETTAIIPIISKSYPSTNEMLDKLKQDYAALDETSPTYVDDAREVHRRAIKVRTTTEKARLAINRRFTATVNEEADRIKAVAQPIEDDLEKRLNDIAIAEATRRQNNFDKAQKALLEAGFTFTGSSYTCDVRIIMPESLYEMPDEVIQEHCTFAADYYANKLAAELKAKEEADKIAAEKKALEDKNAELQRQLEELEEKLAALNTPAPAQEPEPAASVAPEAEDLPTFDTSEPEPTAEPAEPAAADNPFANFSMDFTPAEKAAEALPEKEKSATQMPNEHFIANGPLNVVGANFGGRHVPADNLDVKVTPETITFKEKPAATTPAPVDPDFLDKYEAAFDDGYNAFRQQAIEVFTKPEPKYSRTEWVAFFTNLKVTDKV